MSETLAGRRRFAQVPDDLITDSRLSSHAVRVWARLDRYAGRSGGALPSREALAADLGTSVDIVRRALSELYQAGWITRERVGASNTWRTILHDEPSVEGASGGPKGRPATGTAVVRRRSEPRQERRTDTPLPGEERLTDTPLPPKNGAKNGAKNGSYMRRPRKEKTNDSERTTSSHDSTQLAIVDSDTHATVATASDASRRPNDRGTRIPEDWYPDPELIEWTRQKAPDVGPVDVEEFRDYWLTVPGAKGRKTRWDLAWRNRARELQARRTRQRAPRPGVYDPDRSRTATTNVAAACERAGVANIVELMIMESGE